MTKSIEDQIYDIQKSANNIDTRVGHYDGFRGSLGFVVFLEVVAAIIMFGGGCVSISEAYNSYTIDYEKSNLGMLLVSLSFALGLGAMFQVFILTAIFDIADNSHKIKNYLKVIAGGDEKK